MTAYNKFLWEKVREKIILILRIIIVIAVFYMLFFM